MSSNSTGVIYIFLYCLSTAIASVMLHHFESAYNPSIVVFFSVTVTIIWYNALHLNNFKRIHIMLKENSSQILWLNIGTAIMWLTTFFSLNYLNADIFSAIFFGALPIFILIINYFSKVKSSCFLKEVFCGVIIAIVLFLLCFNQLWKSNFSSEEFIGIGLGLTSALSGAWVIIISRHFAVIGYTATETLSQRFYGLWLSSAAIIITMTPPISSFSFDFIPLGIGIAFLTFIVPVFFFQKGVECINPLNVSFLTPTIPLLSFGIQIQAENYQFDGIEFTLLILLAIAIIFSQFIRRNTTN